MSSLTLTSQIRAGSRGTLSRRAAYWLSAGVISLGLFASLTPSPLYRSYSVLWGFSSLTLTLIFATYAFGVLAALLLLGSVSDDVGRRPVLLTGLAGLLGSTVLFLLADSAAWLFAARGLQGLATGITISAASAALLDLHPQRNPARVGLTNATAAASGLGLGILVSAALVQTGWETLYLPYALLFVLVAIALVGVYFMPEPVSERAGLRVRLERPQVPPIVRRPFILAALAAVSSWSVGALFFSLGPALSAHLFQTTNAVISVIGAVAVAGSAVIGQHVTARTAPWIAAATGSIALSAGMALIVAAVATDSGALYLAGSIVGGLGFGAAFLGGLRALNAAIPFEQRASVLSAFFVVAYASLSVPAVLAGVAVTYISLGATFEIFGAILAALALLVAAEAIRQRPTQPAPAAAAI